MWFCGGSRRGIARTYPRQSSSLSFSARRDRHGTPSRSAARSRPPTPRNRARHSSSAMSARPPSGTPPRTHHRKPDSSDFRMDIPTIEQVKIQARALVPLVKALQAELGEERANAIVRLALGELYRSYGEKWWRTQGSQDLGSNMAAAFGRFAAGDA